MEKEISTNREGNAETGLKLRYRKMELHTQTAVQSQSQQIRECSSQNNSNTREIQLWQSLMTI